MTSPRPWILVLIGATACTSPDDRASGARLTIDRSRQELVATDPDRGAMTVLDLGTGAVGEVPLGSEPSRIVRAGDQLWVSLRGERAVVRLERKGGAWSVASHVDVGAEPMGLAIDGDALYVAASLADAVQQIALSTERVTRTFSVPGHPRALALHPGGRTLFVGTELGGLQHVTLETGEVRPIALPFVRGALARLSIRITGDLVMAPGGERVTVPVLLMDIESPLDVARDTVIGGGSYGVVIRSGEPRFLPALLDVELSGEGEPTGTVTVTPLVPEGTTRGQPTAIAYDDSGTALWISFEGEDGIFRLPGVPSARTEGTTRMVDGLGYGEGIAPISSDRAAVVSNLTRAVSVMGEQATTVRALLPSPLGEAALHGRRLFYRADDAAMSSGGLSCATCHFEGRTDGVTWRFDRGLRQTPSLSEKVSQRTPLRWTGDRVSVAQDAQMAAAAMGGGGITSDDAQAVQAYVDSIRSVDLPLRGAETTEIAAGRAVFEQAGCASCHSGTMLTDSQMHAIGGRESVLTPSLLGVAATPPYMFDGSEPTLASLVESAEMAMHGNGKALTEADRAVLVTYLESL